MLFIYIANKTGRNKWFGLEHFFKKQDEHSKPAKDELMARPNLSINDADAQKDRNTTRHYETESRDLLSDFAVLKSM